MKSKQVKLAFKFLKYLSPYRKKYGVALILTGLSAVLSVAIPYLTKLIVDNAILVKQIKSLILFGSVAAAVFILNGTIKAGVRFLMRKIQLAVSLELNNAVFRHLQQLPVSFFHNRSTGEHMFKIHHDIEQVSEFIVGVPEDVIRIIPRFIMIIAIVFCLNWKMALFSLVLVPLLYVPVYYITYLMRNVLRRVLENSQNIFGQLEEVFSHMYMVKAFRTEKEELRKYLGALKRNVKVKLENVRLEMTKHAAVGGIERIAIGIITLFGGYQVIKGSLTPGALTAIILYLTQLVSLHSESEFSFQRIAFGLVSCKRVNEVLEQQGVEDSKSIQAQEKGLRGYSIQFKKVSFSYENDKPVLENLSFCMNEGFIALVGASGCGKTTILNLILGLYRPETGKVFIGGNEAANLGSYFFREDVAVALQEPFLWNKSLRDNIAYARSDATQDEIIAAAETADVESFAKALPQGYSTILGENACKLSEGQKQRVALARALIKKPKILILDEAFSSIDSASEEKIINNIRQKYHDAVTIVVSHRLSTVMTADLVYFLTAPDAMEIARAEELLEDNDTFRRLFAAQIQ